MTNSWSKQACIYEDNKNWEDNVRPSLPRELKRTNTLLQHHKKKRQPWKHLWQTTEEGEHFAATHNKERWQTPDRATFTKTINTTESNNLLSLLQDNRAYVELKTGNQRNHNTARTKHKHNQNKLQHRQNTPQQHTDKPQHRTTTRQNSAITE